jgi:hypothetical protein
MGSNNKKTDPNDAVALMIKNGFKPLEPYKSYQAPWKCKCLACGKTVYPSYGNQKKKKSKCLYCAGMKVDAIDARNLMLKSKLRPLEPYRNNGTKWKCKCLICGKVVTPTVETIISGKGGCWACRSKKIGQAKRFPEKEAIKIFLKADLKPLVSYKTSKSPWKSECLKCGKIVYPRLASLVSRGSSCPWCATLGLDLKLPSIIYLITNEQFNAHKIGIMNQKSERLTSFKKRGWIEFKSWKISTGFEATEIEKEIFKIIRKDLKLPIYLLSQQMPITGGHTETVSSDSITLFELEKIIRKVIKGYRQ